MAVYRLYVQIDLWQHLNSTLRSEAEPLNCTYAPLIVQNPFNNCTALRFVNQIREAKKKGTLAMLVPKLLHVYFTVLVRK